MRSDFESNDESGAAGFEADHARDDSETPELHDNDSLIQMAMARSRARCIWLNDRCQHGANIDDPTTTWNADTRRFTCAANTETRSA